MNSSIILQVAIPTFILLVLGVGLTIYEFHKDFKKLKKMDKSKRKQ